MSRLQLPDGLVVFVKRSCPTCELIEAQIREAAGRVADFHVVSQDDPAFPGGVPGVIDDRELDLSWLSNIEAMPTLLRIENGRETERVMGWDRAAWQRLTGLRSLGAHLPALRPG
ncbi:MAG: hypothetical protein ACK59Y_00830 [Betaproteobacteria bacterium]